MSKKLILFEEENLEFQQKFYILMDLLITNQSSSRLESFLLLTVFYIQIISSFFSEYLGILEPKISKSDKILNHIEKLFRLKNLFNNNLGYYRIFELIVFIIILLLILHFFISVLFVTKNSFYSFNKKFINCYIKLFIYVGYNIIYDICFSSFCISSDDINRAIDRKQIQCLSQNKLIIILSIINIAVSLIFYIFINIYYNDSFYLSSSYYAKMSCHYDVFWGLNCLVISFILSQIKTFTKELFLLYNVVISVILFIYYINHYIYYDKFINILTGIFHLLYVWISILSLIFAYLDFREKGIIYIITSIFIYFFYFNIKNRIETNIFINTPFYKITNKFYLLHYFRKIYELINNVEGNKEDKSLLSGIIKMHLSECPNPNCLLKTKEDIYLPLTNKWNDKNKKPIEDDVFLKNFLIIIMNYFLFTEDCSADMYLNLSLYYLKVIGNFCQAIYFYKKVTELKLTLREEFSFIRLNIQISKELVEKLRSSNEQCTELEHLNTSMYFKYEELSQNFLDEINNDITFSLEFWKSFQIPYIEINKKIDFNKIFELTDKIRITKENIEIIWNNLMNIYSGINDLYELYLEYVEQINDDDLKKRDLESLRRKNDNYLDHVNSNYYSFLFNKETGILIVNGDKGKEGFIELANKETENIFKYTPFDLKGSNVIILMPKIFAKDHCKYMENYFKIGQKKLVDKNDLYTFAIDKDNSIIKIRIALKLFPILNDDVLFISLIQKENLDDIIFLDDKFNIQGMSMKLMKILRINNKCLFQNNEIPFYVICRKFVNFYNIFLKGKKKGIISEKKNTVIEEEGFQNKDGEIKQNDKKEHEDIEKEEIHENIEINENVELEYEIILPQFLIDYSEKTNKKEAKSAAQMLTIQTESEEEVSEIIEEFDEEDILLEEERNNNQGELKLRKITSLNRNKVSGEIVTPTPTPTPMGDTPTPGATPLSDTIEEESDMNNLEQNIVFNKESEEEKRYKMKMEQYVYLFNEGKINELEELIDNCNKNTSSIEYKFNFTFDKSRYGNKQISYIVRCIDNKIDAGQSSEESLGDIDPKAAKYKKEKAESIKPLFELLEDERKEILHLPEIFLNLSLENKKFQKLLQDCKNDLNIMSKTHGNKKDEILEDENSSQTSQTGFDNGLVKKNKIEEIRSNLMNNISNFYTLKYIKIIIYLVASLSIIFAGLYTIFFYPIYINLKESTNINIYLYQTTLWTTELISIFLNIRAIFKNQIIIKNESEKFQYLDFISEGKNLSQYYNFCISKSYSLIQKLFKHYGILEMEMAKYLPDLQLDNLYWDNLKISYADGNYKKFTNNTDDEESFSMAIGQLLSNSLTFVESSIFNTIENNIYFSMDKENFEKYFLYMSHLIIKNGYDNIRPNLFKKINKIPKLLAFYNISQINGVILLICFYLIAIIIFCIIYFILIHLTNKSMIDAMDKVSQIKKEKIEEIIKRIRLFNINLKKFVQKDTENKENSELYDDNDSKINSVIKDELNKDKNKKKQSSQISSLINNNGFNIDSKRYIPLYILRKSYIYSIVIPLVAIPLLVSIATLIYILIRNVNQLLLVQKFIFMKLIMTSSLTIEVKCFISDCQLINKIDIGDMEIVGLNQDVVKGINLFSKVKDFYNEKFLINACKAAITNETSEEYKNCLNDPLIETTNNTENFLKLMAELSFTLQNEFEINKRMNNDSSYSKNILYSNIKYLQMEKIFFNYFLPVEENFVKSIKDDMNSYLFYHKMILLFLILLLEILMILICIATRLILIKSLVHYLTISRCIMKILPTSVIINTPELESWIENKY